MIDLYSNENFPIDAVIILRKLGCDVLTSYEAGQANQGIPDDAVLTYATKNKRALITLNRQDFIKLHRNTSMHSGIIICKDDRDHSAQMSVLYQYLLSQANLDSCLVRVLKQNQKGKTQQLFVVKDYER